MTERHPPPPDREPKPDPRDVPEKLELPDPGEADQHHHESALTASDAHFPIPTTRASIIATIERVPGVRHAVLLRSRSGTEIRIRLNAETIGGATLILHAVGNGKVCFDIIGCSDQGNLRAAISAKLRADGIDVIPHHVQ